MEFEVVRNPQKRTVNEIRLERKKKKGGQRRDFSHKLDRTEKM